MSEDDLIRALERHASALTQRGKTLQAADARRVAYTLRQALKEHKLALEEVVRSEERTRAGGDGLADAKAVMQIKWAMVLDSQERARRFLEAPR